jgi:DNA helicase II / ATP-dependent DNA helicase PcrA
MTIHKAKGLEASLVILVGVEDGTMPLAYRKGEAKSTERDREERNLAFVAASRARDKFIATYVVDPR